MRLPIAVALTVLTLTACAVEEPTGEPSKPKADPCIKLSGKTLDALAEGFKVKADLTRGFAVKRPADEVEMNLRYIAALEVKDSTTQTAMMAMGEIKPGGGPWVGADNYAKLYFEWGAAATKSSPLGRAARPYSQHSTESTTATTPTSSTPRCTPTLERSTPMTEPVDMYEQGWAAALNPDHPDHHDAPEPALDSDR